MSTHTWCGLSVNLECRSEMCCTWLAENTGCKKSPSGHHHTTLSGYIFTTKACIDNWKKMCSAAVSPPHVPRNMVNFVPLVAEIVSLVWGTPANFNGFRILAALLHGTPVLGVSQTLRHWTEGATYIRQGGHHIGHWPTFLVSLVLMLFYSELVRACHWSCYASSKWGSIVFYYYLSIFHLWVIRSCEGVFFSNNWYVADVLSFPLIM